MFARLFLSILPITALSSSPATLQQLVQLLADSPTPEALIDRLILPGTTYHAVEHIDRTESYGLAAPLQDAFSAITATDLREHGHCYIFGVDDTQFAATPFCAASADPVSFQVFDALITHYNYSQWLLFFGATKTALAVPPMVQEEAETAVMIAAATAGVAVVGAVGGLAYKRIADRRSQRAQALHARNEAADFSCHEMVSTWGKFNASDLPESLPPASHGPLQVVEPAFSSVT